MRFTYTSMTSVLVVGWLLSATFGALATQAAPPSPEDQGEPPTSEAQLGAAQVSQRSSAISGAFALTDSPQGNYAPNLNISARISQAFDLQGASSATLAFWQKYSLGPASAVSTHSGSYALTDSPDGDYSNYADISARITQPLDFSTVTNPHLTFWHYYEIEGGYDDLYVEVSTDGSAWTAHASYTGDLDTYAQADIDLSGYAGQATVYLRFRLDTDGIVTRDGWVVDDLLVKDGAVTLFSDGFESGTGDWVLDAPWDAVGSSVDQATV